MACRNAPAVTPHHPFPGTRRYARAGEYDLERIVDDRFDRRELLLHLGDVLEAMRNVGATQAFSPVALLASREPSLQALPFLQHMSPRLRARDFLERAASAYARWPRALLETELDRAELASTVQRELFADDPLAWASYAAYVRQKVSWFGLELDKSTHASTAVNDDDEENGGTSPTPAMKTGWPWKPIE
ncbi:hypothetical protein AB3X91_08065 [Paraburkholderia sp. BR14263]|uniref:hypothetical protein n=1 Tax=unclassified Paraburkholderia TaxID=2615204 RepID=UPI0034CF25D2